MLAAETTLNQAGAVVAARRAADCRYRAGWRSRTRRPDRSCSAIIVITTRSPAARRGRHRPDEQTQRVVDQPDPVPPTCGGIAGEREAVLGEVAGDDLRRRDARGLSGATCSSSRVTVWSNIVTQSGRSGRTWALSSVSRRVRTSSRVTTATARQWPCAASRPRPRRRSDRGPRSAGVPFCSSRRSSAAASPPPRRGRAPRRGPRGLSQRARPPTVLAEGSAAAAGSRLPARRMSVHVLDYPTSACANQGSGVARRTGSTQRPEDESQCFLRVEARTPRRPALRAPALRPLRRATPPGAGARRRQAARS